MKHKQRTHMNLKYNTYHTFEFGGNYYLFDNETLISCIIDERVYDALNNNDVSFLTENEIQMLELFHERGIFFVDSPQVLYNVPKRNKVIISLALFHGCNLNCKYCFADSGENFKGEQRGFKESSINAAIDFLLNNPEFCNYDYYRINLVSGGEPLLNKELFMTFIERTFACFDAAKKHLYIWFSTNGTLLSEDILLFISKYNVGYGISIDGDKSANDKLRTYTNGLGTYNDIILNIKKIKNSLYIPKRLKELWGLMVYTRYNIDLIDNIKHLRDLGFSTVQMRFVRSNDNRIALDKSEASKRLYSFVEIIFEQAISGDDSMLRLICNDSDYVGKIIKRIILQEPVEIRCGAGSCMYSFAADGNIYPCDCFVGNPEFVMGNFYDSVSKEQMEKYKDLSIHNRENCKKCWARYVCGGDCYHNSYLKHQNILSPDESYCEIILKVIEHIIACSNQYNLKNEEGYKALRNFLNVREKVSFK